MAVFNPLPRLFVDHVTAVLANDYKVTLEADAQTELLALVAAKTTAQDAQDPHIRQQLVDAAEKLVATAVRQHGQRLARFDRQIINGAILSLCPGFWPFC